MRLVFMGSPAFAVPALRALHEAGHQITAVYCQPPRPAGRGHAVQRCAVHQAADALGLAVRTPARLRGNAEAQREFAAFRAEAAVIAAYGLILPRPMLEAPRRGCLNIHASLLPRWRGAAPIQAAILAGDAETGISIMQMDEGLDTGPVLLREAVAISSRATSAELHDILAALGARLILRALAENPSPEPQPSFGASYAPKLSREAGQIDWNRSAAEIERMVRAFDPWPGAFTLLGGISLKVLAAEPVAMGGVPGTVLDEQLTVACGEGALRISRVQRAGRGPMDAAAFLRGHQVPAGKRLG